MRYCFILMFVVVLACQLQQAPPTKNEEQIAKAMDTLSVPWSSDSVTPITTQMPSFFDSVAAKSELSFEQINARTLIDSTYYTGLFSEARFIGDTVVHFYKGFKGAVIEYDDRRSCIYKFLLIF